MILEKCHVAGAISNIGQHCAACHCVITPLKPFYAPGQRVGVIVATTAGVAGHYPVLTVTRETPEMCRR